MKTMMRYAIPVTAILLGAGARAQAGTPLMDAVVPFPFVVNGHTLPAGKYTIERDDVASSVLVLRGDGKHHSEVFVPAIHEEARPTADRHPTLTFERKGDQYLLKQVRDDERDQWDLMR